MHVCFSAGQFDVSLARFDNRTAAGSYLDQVQPLCDYALEIKSDESARLLDETFSRDDILISVRVTEQ